MLAVVPGQEEERRARVASICDAFKDSPQVLLHGSLFSDHRSWITMVGQKYSKCASLQGRLVEAEVKYEKDRANSSLGMIAQAGKKKISPYKVMNYVL